MGFPTHAVCSKILHVVKQREKGALLFYVPLHTKTDTNMCVRDGVRLRHLFSFVALHLIALHYHFKKGEAKSKNSQKPDLVWLQTTSDRHKTISAFTPGKDMPHFCMRDISVLR